MTSHAASILTLADASKVTMEEVLAAICRVYRVTAVDLVSHRRHRSLVRPRHAYCHLCRELTGVTITQIGASLGNRHHTTVMHGIKRVRYAFQTRDTATTAPIGMAMTELALVADSSGRIAVRDIAVERGIDPAAINLIACRAAYRRGLKDGRRRIARIVEQVTA